MSWSLVLDIVLVLVFIGALVNGWRSGLLRTAAGLLGLIAGAIASYFVMPWVAALVPWPEWRAPAALATALVLLGLGAWLGAISGHALRSGAHAAKLGVLDRVLGSIGNLLVTAFVVALVASGISAMGVPVLSPAVAGSRVLQTLDTITPAPTRSLLAQHFVKPGLLAAERSKDLAQLDALRTSGDYDSAFALGPAEIEPELEKAGRFVAEARDILRDAGWLA